MIGPEHGTFGEEGAMRNRREFFRALAGGAGALAGGALAQLGAQTPGGRREVRVAGKRVKVVDIHAHATFPEVADVIKDGPLARFRPRRQAD